MLFDDINNDTASNKVKRLWNLTYARDYYLVYFSSNIIIGNWSLTDLNNLKQTNYVHQFTTPPQFGTLRLQFINS